MALEISRKHFKVLAAYAVVPGIKLRWDKDQDERNAEKPRSFCYVRPDDPLTIYCAKTLDNVSTNVRIGILLHEIGHIQLDAFNGDECEVDVDDWVLREFPESGYTYKDHKYYNELTGKYVIGHSLQHVSRKFLETLHLRDRQRP